MKKNARIPKTYSFISPENNPAGIRDKIKKYIKLPIAVAIMNSLNRMGLNPAVILIILVGIKGITLA
jgi:hypothetical protein